MSPRHPILPIALLGTLCALPGCLVEEFDYEAFETRDQYIVGGADTEISQVPWQVSLRAANGAHFCGGSILSPTWIATAAHCVEGIQPAQVVAGATRLSQGNTGQVRAVVRAITVPGYSDPSVGKDAALLELQTPLELNGTTVRAIRPVKAANAALVAPGTLATASGWGTLEEGAQGIPDVLQSVQVPIVSLQDASADYAGTGVSLPLTEDQLPAGVRGVGGKDSCQGDSGGPLVVSDGAGDFMLAGIVSWGIGCAQADYPGLYARVSSFTVWMDGHVGGPPVANAGQDMTTGAGNTVQLTAAASYDQGFGDIVAYRWSQVSGDSVVLQGSEASAASFVAPGASGSLEFELTITDDQGLTATDRVVVNQAPAGTPTTGGDGSIIDGGGAGGPGNVVGGCSTGSGSTGGLAGLLMLLAAFGLRRRERC